MSGFQTPGAMRAYQRLVDDGFETLHADVVSNQARLSAKWRSGFKRAYASWKEYLRDNSWWGAYAWGSTMDMAERYSEILDAWRQSYQRRTGEAPTGPNPPRTNSPGWENAMATAKWIAIGLGAVMVGGAVMQVTGYLPKPRNA